MINNEKQGNQDENWKKTTSEKQFLTLERGAGRQESIGKSGFHYEFTRVETIRNSVYWKFVAIGV